MVLAQIHCVTPAVPKEIRPLITSTTQAGRATFARAQEADVLSYIMLFQHSCCAKQCSNLNSARCSFFEEI